VNKIVIVVVVLLLLLGGYFYMQSKQGGLTNLGQPGSSQTSEFVGSIMEAMGRNVPMKCTWTSGADSAEIYVKGEMMYTQSTTDGKLGYMVRKDGCNYIWGDQMEQGVKMCIDLEASTAPLASGYTTPAGQAEVSGPDLNASYRCLPTVVSDDKFNPPTDVQFQDMSEVMNKMMQNLPSAPAIPNYGN